MSGASSSSTRLVVGTAVFLFGATAAHGADGDPPSAEQLETVVVTAQRRSEDVQKVPITIQAFTAKTIRDLGLTSSTDMGQVTPNLSIALPSGAGNQPIITIRGIGLNDFNSNNAGPNGVYVDEVYLSAPGSQTFQLFDLDRIEVLKGPQGTLYGRNTSGGAINFISAKPSSEASANLVVDYSSFKTSRVEGAIGGAINSDLSARLAFVKNDSDGYMHNALTGQRENGSNDYGVRAQLDWHPGETFDVLFNLHGGEVDTRPVQYRHVGTLDPATGQPCSTSDALGGRCVDAYGYGPPAGFYDGSFNRQQKLHVSNAGGSVNLTWSPSDITFKSITAYEQNRKLHPEDTDASPYRLVEVDYGVRSNTVTQEFRLSQTVGALHWVGGLYGLYEKLYQDQPVQAFLDFDRFYGADAGDGIAQISQDRNRQVTKSAALFGQADYALDDRWTLTLGGRFTSERKSFRTAAAAQYQVAAFGVLGPTQPLWAFDESTKSSRASGRVALDYQATEQMNVYGSAASGFKSGGFNGGFLSADPTEALRQIGPVKPETVVAYEFGLKSQWLERRVQFNLAFFYNDYKDIQVFNQIAPVIPGGFDLMILTNAPKAHTEGIDLQLVAKPTASLTTTFNLGLLQAKIDRWNTASGTGSTVDYTGHRLPLAPTTSLAATIAYRVPLGVNTLDLFADYNYRTRQYFDVANDPLITQKRYGLANVRASYAFDQGRWTVAGYVRNLFDKHYLSDAINLTNPFGFVQDVVGTPRTVGVELAYRY